MLRTIVVIAPLAWMQRPLLPQDFVPSTNGRDLAGWDGDKRYWSAEDGAITRPHDLARGRGRRF
jgi:hypothetical protein